MTDTPRIPEELSFVDTEASVGAVSHPEGRLMGQPRDAEFASGTRDRFGELKRNRTNRWMVQER